MSSMGITTTQRAAPTIWMRDEGETYSEFHSRMEKLGKQYEHFCMRFCLEESRFIESMTPSETLEDQLHYGDTLEGHEIKHDGRYRETGKLYIEQYELSKTGVWLHSSITRPKTGIKFFIIGDRQTIYIFEIDHIRAAIARKKPDGSSFFFEIETKTSIAILLPVNESPEETCEYISEIIMVDSRYRTDWEERMRNFMFEYRYYIENRQRKRGLEKPVEVDYGLDPYRDPYGIGGGRLDEDRVC